MMMSLQAAKRVVKEKKDHYRLHRLEYYEARSDLDFVINSPTFQILMCATVLLHVAFMIYEADLSFRTLQPMPRVLHGTIEVAFWLVYAVELALCLKVDGWGHFRGRDGKLQMFDAFLVVLGLIDIVCTLSGIHFFNTFVMKVLRVARLNRLARTHRLMLFSEHMTRLFRTVAACCSSFAGPAIMVTGYFLVFSLIIVPAVARYLAANEGTLTAEELDSYADNFSSVSRCMFRLYQSVTPGQDWVRMYDLLERISFWRFGTFYVFFHFVYLVLVANIVLCGLVEKILIFSMGEVQAVKHDEDRKDHKHLNWILSFCEKELGPGSTISFEEFLRLMHNVALRRHFDMRGVKIDDTKRIFKALNCQPPEQKSHKEWDFRIDRAHFFDTCMRLKRDVTILDVIGSHSCLLHRLGKQQDTCDQIMSKLGEVEAQILAAVRKAAGIAR